MAQYNVTLNYDPSFGGLIIIDSPSGGTSSGDPLVVSPNDTIVFTNNNANSATVSGQSTNRYNTSNLAIAGNNANTLTVLSSYTDGTDTATIAIGTGTSPFYLSAVGGVDTVPDSFNIGKPVTSAQRSTIYEFLPFNVEGITDTANISATGCQFKKGSGGAWITSSTVGPNDTIYVRATSSSSYNTTTSMSIYIGGVGDSNTIRTKNNPSDGARLYFPKSSRPVSLTDLSNFFSAPVGTANTVRIMSAFRRGGLHVPDIAENSGIADTNQSNNLTLGQFLNSATIFTFDRYPKNKWTNIGEGGARAGGVSWTADLDWELGYSPLTKYNVEYRYEITRNTNYSGDVETFTSSGAATGTYAANNFAFSVQGTAPSGKARYYSGTIKIFMRSLINSSLFLTTEVEYELSFQGDLQET
jgi:hypothetical protein